MSERSEHEIQHGKFLAGGDTELIWGWGTLAGRVRAKRRAKLIEIGARLGQDSHVLEIGCGTGMFTEMFAKTECSITAVDISAALLKKAEERKLPKGKIRFLEKRFEDCEAEGPFDAIVGSSISHHLELDNALSRIYGLLKPGGIMSFAEPNMLNPQVFVERKLRRLLPYISPDETAFVRWQFSSTLQKTGFKNIKIVPFDWLHPSVPEQLIDFVSSVGRVIERLHFYVSFQVLCISKLYAL
ncbi:MAG: class I SAM-dependent methyltransferase [Desulfobacteraceae bacterium]|nr:class I SAM-dependent methyltransferase [Desulfobacteraceae bacterium]